MVLEQSALRPTRLDGAKSSAGFVSGSLLVMPALLRPARRWPAAGRHARTSSTSRGSGRFADLQYLKFRQLLF